MKFGFEDREYEFDGNLTVEEAIFLQEKTGLGINEVDQALFKGNPLAIAAWIYTLKRRAGEAVKWTDMLKMNVRSWKVIPDEPSDEERQLSDAPSPDPTQATGPTPEGATTAT